MSYTINKIVIPHKIADEIRVDGIMQAERGRETLGILIGNYEEADNSIVVSKRYNTGSKIGDSSQLGNIVRDIIRQYLSIPYLMLRSAQSNRFHRITKSDGKIPAEVMYHSHPYPRGLSWSLEDLTHQFEIEGIPTAMLLYITRWDEFIARNRYRIDIPVIEVGGNPIVPLEGLVQRTYQEHFGETPIHSAVANIIFAINEYYHIFSSESKPEDFKKIGQENISNSHARMLTIQNTKIAIAALLNSSVDEYHACQDPKVLILRGIESIIEKYGPNYEFLRTLLESGSLDVVRKRHRLTNKEEFLLLNWHGFVRFP